MGDSAPRALGRKALLVLVSILLVLNLFTFLPAFSQISSIDSGCCSNHPLAKDFSGVYIGAWRLFHDPTEVYTHGNVSDGEPPIYPQPEQYKYLPSYLLLVSPILLLPYAQSMVLYDTLQFLLLPLIGVLVSSLTKEKGWAVTIIAETLVLLLPAAAPGWGFSVGYFWQWKEAQSKVIETLLLTSSFYLGMRRRPVWSGVMLGIAFFDPRFAIAATPLFLAYNTTRTSSAFKSLLATVVVSNLALLYPGLGIGFLRMVFSTGVGTALYPYAIIPLAEVVFLSCINYYEIGTELVRIVKLLQSRTIIKSHSVL
jgi:glycosyl transferase family 87